MMILLGLLQRQVSDRVGIFIVTGQLYVKAEDVCHSESHSSYRHPSYESQTMSCGWGAGASCSYLWGRSSSVTPINSEFKV